MKENMYYGASHLIFERAELLRNKMTRAEEILWQYIHINEWKLKFRRQHPIWQYIADFYCHKLKLVIELDGSIHNLDDVKENDIIREQNLKNFGLTILRFTNTEVINSTVSVLEKIKKTIDDLQRRIKDKEVEVSSFDTPLGEGGNGGKNSIFVIKIGGNVIDNTESLQSFLKDFAAIKGHKILIHGGGKIATKIGDQLGVSSKYINGRRITDDDTIDIVTMVYGGLVNKKIVTQLQSLKCNSIGLCGADANIIPATKRPPVSLSFGEGRDEVVDFGWVGDIDQPNMAHLKLLIEAGLTPVFAPLTHDGQGHILNTNADTIAATIAVGLSSFYKVRLIYCFEKKGVLEDVNDENSVISNINKEKYKQLVNENRLFEGILPKIDNAFAAIDAGVNEVLIGHAEDLIKNTTNATKGTLISG